MRFGLTKEQEAWVTSHIVKPIENEGGTVFCFGSRATGKHAKFSDLDLMIEGYIQQKGLVGKIKESAEESNFPFKVDLVVFNDFNPNYLENYKKQKTLWTFVPTK